MADPIPRGSPVITYVRNSDDTQLHSRDDQETVIGYTVEEFGLDVVYPFSDAGVSGSTIDERSGLKTLLATAREKKAKYLLVQDPSRLSRGGQTDFWTIIKALKQAGIIVYSCKHRMFVTEANGAIFAIEAAQAHGHNVALSYNVTRSQMESCRTRKNDPGRVPPYGYDRMRYDAQGKPVLRIRYNPNGTKAEIDPDTGAIRGTYSKNEDLRKPKSQVVKLVPGDPAKVATLRRIFKLAKTTGFTGIADLLNREGIPGPNGKKWPSSSIRSILLNPVYTGEVIQGATRRAKYHSMGKDLPQEYDFLRQGNLNQGDVPKDEWYREAGRHEALITPDEWDEVQDALQKRSRQHTKTLRSPNRFFLLSGLVRCVRCGGVLQGTNPKNQQGKAYPYYVCSTRQKHGASQCKGESEGEGRKKSHRVPAQALEERVIAEVRAYFSTDCCKDFLREGLERELAGQERGRARVSAKKKELAELEAKKQAWFDTLTPDQVTAFQKLIDQLITDEGRVRRELAEAEREEGRLEDKAATIERAVKFYEENVLSLTGGCQNALREGLIALGTEVTWDPDKQEGGLKIYPFGRSAAI